jgi:hypothetical protein
MKKLMLILVIAMAVPAMAAVNFTAADDGEGNLVISYTTTDGDLPRGVALRVELTGGTVDPADAENVEVDAAFNAFVDYAYYAVDASLPYDLDENKGHPLADPLAAGVLAAADSVFSISAGVLDQTGNQAAGPAETTLISIPIICDAEATEIAVTISADTLRGPDSGVVGSVLESNLPITTTITSSCGDVPPACWSYPCQPKCDTDGDGDVDSADVGVAVNGWNNYEGMTGDIPNKCADTDRDGDVDSADIGNLVSGWNDGCPQ